MRGLAIAVALTLTGLSPSASQANFVSGHDLHKWCQNEAKIDQALCVAFTMGVIDMIQSAQHSGDFKPSICFPDTAKGGQVVDVAKKWFVDNPQHRHFVASDLVKVAMEEAFPCAN